MCIQFEFIIVKKLQYVNLFIEYVCVLYLGVAKTSEIPNPHSWVQLNFAKVQ